ncbi:thiamine pyrophosphate-dependent dehydrogenase E1 component subunit alpha [Dactylosporangium sp. CA-092794]|uniref:thiamine pyrophosphate-dependent dehydrogenase E1 component subunit alpha n=1 Tax=Dactylosporangium sp. CA-092794 TaxID=3239929 RepID=UPI003D8E41D4
MTTTTDRRAAVAADPVEALRRMIEIRHLEDALNRLYSDGRIRGSIHTCQGQEAVSVAAAACSRPDDYATATYRGHGVALAFGSPPLGVAAEVLGRADGCVGGLGGSMHLADASVNVLPTMAIVGAGLPIAVGAALGAQVRGHDAVSFAFFGDGSTNIGAFHESLNIAAVWRLPVVFVCENNLYGEYSPLASTTAVPDIAQRGPANGVPSEIVDGQDFVALADVLGRAVATARAGGGPTLVEAKTYRYHGHSRADPAAYRPEGELDAWTARDPIAIYREHLIARGTLTADAADALAAEVRAAVDEAVAAAVRSPAPPADRLFAHVYG